MPTLKPYRNYDEKDVINNFAFSGSLPVNKGTLVSIQGSGFVPAQDPVEMLGAPGASYANTVSQRYGVPFKVAAAGTGDKPLGILLYDVKETDENGNLLKWNPKAAWEREIVLSGQAVPIARKGVFHYSGITGTVTAGQKLYVGLAGTIDSLQLLAAQQVGVALGAKDSTGATVILLDIV